MKPGDVTPYSKKKEQKMDIDWDFFKEIPIEDVAEVLGLDVDPRTKSFLCPSHNDTRPSAKLRLKTNTWKCFSCGAYGSTIDLVMAVEGLSNFQAVFYLNRFFPGGISVAEEETKNRITPPYIPPDLLKEIGLKKNPYSDVRVKTVHGVENDKKPNYSFEEYGVSYTEATELIIDKLQEYIFAWKEYGENVCRDFPKIGFNSEMNRYIWDTIEEKIKPAKTYLAIFTDFAQTLEPESNPYPWDTGEHPEGRDEL